MAQNAPYKVKVEKGKTYYWCACGKSTKEPFCSGAHQGTGVTPKSFVAEKDGDIYLCGCKQSAKPPFCDGSHQKLAK